MKRSSSLLVIVIALLLVTTAIIALIPSELPRGFIGLGQNLSVEYEPVEVLAETQTELMPGTVVDILYNEDGIQIRPRDSRLLSPIYYNGTIAVNDVIAPHTHVFVPTSEITLDNTDFPLLAFAFELKTMNDLGNLQNKQGPRVLHRSTYWYVDLYWGFNDFILIPEYSVHYKDNNGVSCQYSRGASVSDLSPDLHVYNFYGGKASTSSLVGYFNDRSGSLSISVSSWLDSGNWRIKPLDAYMRYVYISPQTHDPNDVKDRDISNHNYYIVDASWISEDGSGFVYPATTYSGTFDRYPDIEKWIWVFRGKASDNKLHVVYAKNAVLKITYNGIVRQWDIDSDDYAVDLITAFGESILSNARVQLLVPSEKSRIYGPEGLQFKIVQGTTAITYSIGSEGYVDVDITGNVSIQVIGYQREPTVSVQNMSSQIVVQVLNESGYALAGAYVKVLEGDTVLLSGTTDALGRFYIDKEAIAGYNQVILSVHYFDVSRSTYYSTTKLLSLEEPITVEDMPESSITTTQTAVEGSSSAIVAILILAILALMILIVAKR